MIDDLYQIVMTISEFINIGQSIIFKYTNIMSDLHNLFANPKQTHPSKRLFSTENSQHRQRSIEPHKNKERPSTTKTVLSQSQLPKRTLSKHHLKKELKLYNNQILVCLVRKVFFMIVAILLFNFLATDFSRPILYSNLLLAFSQFDMHFDSDFFGSPYYRLLAYFIQVAAFAVNFFYLLAQISHTNLLAPATPLMVISANGALNYLCLLVLQPVVRMRGVKNLRKPYLGFTEKTLSQIQLYFQSLKTYYQLGRPLLCVNLTYWLAVIAYIIKTQQETLFFNIFTLPLFKASLATGIALHLFLKLADIVDSKIGIELLSSNKKEINLNLLRLSEEHSGRNIHWQIEKYIWSSCESFWDTQFLTRHYQINYDLLEDYMTREIQKLEKTIKHCLTALQHTSDPAISKNSTKSSRGLVLRWRYIAEYYCVLDLIVQLQSKIYLFYIVDQIALFRAMGTSAPVSMQKIHKGINRVARSLESLQQSVEMRELRLCLFQLSCFLCRTIEREEE